MDKFQILILISLAVALVNCTKISILDIQPAQGPCRGGTRVLVHTNTIKMDIERQFPRPKCKFASMRDLVNATYVKCPSRPKKVDDLDAETKQKDDVCLQCDDSPEHDKDETVPFGVSLTGDFSDLKNSAAFRYYPDAEITAIYPQYGLKNGRTVVEVWGNNFLNFEEELRCSFGTREVPAEFHDKGYMTCVTPDSNVVDIAMPFTTTLNDQQSTQGVLKYYYYEHPAVSEFQPNRGPDTGGTKFLVLGRNFDPFHKIGGEVNVTNDTFCYFLDLEIKRPVVQMINSTKLYCMSPPSPRLRATRVEITLNNQQYTDDEVVFYYYRPPNVFDLDPLIGPVAGGTNVTVIGSNFKDTGELKCKFGNSVVPGKFLNVNEILCVSPRADKPGFVRLKVALYEEEFSSGEYTQFLYYENPVITSISPTCGPERGYTELTVRGENFLDTGFDMVKCVYNFSGEVIWMNATVIDQEMIKCSTPPVLNSRGYNELDRWYYDVTITLNNIIPDKAHYIRFYYYKESTIMSVTPDIGPMEGGTVVEIKGKDFKPKCHCNFTVRFGTVHVKAKEFSDERVVVEAPAAWMPGEVVVTVGINGQQWSPDIKLATKDAENTYIYYEKPIITHYEPEVGPSHGGTKVIFHGYGLTPFSDEEGSKVVRPLYVAMLDYKTKKLGEPTECTYLDDREAHFFTPPGKAESHHIFKITFNKQDFLPVIPKGSEYSYTYYEFPSIKKLDPPYGPVKSDRETILILKGVNFRCPENICTHILVRFGEADDAIYVPGEHISDEEIHCVLPKYSKPDVLRVEVTLNEQDYTNDGLEFGYYDPFVKKVTPKMVGMEGGTTIRIHGHGFVNSTCLKVKFGGISQRNLTCNGKDCVVKAKYISQNEVEAVTFPEKVVYYEGCGEDLECQTSITNDDISVEVSVFGNDFTHNFITIFYFTLPLYDQPLNSKIPGNANELVMVPTHFLTHETDPMDPVNKQWWFEKYGNVSCRYMSEDGTRMVQTTGYFAHYALKEDKWYNHVECKPPLWQLPKGKDQENVLLNISVNGGGDYSGMKKMVITEQLELKRIYPLCGPNTGGTKVRIVGTGMQLVENLTMKWGVITTSIIDEDTFENWYFDAAKTPNTHELEVLSNNALDQKYMLLDKKDYKKVMTKAPQIPDSALTLGGPVYIELGRVAALQVHQSKEFKIFNYGPSFLEYFYYQNPTLRDMKPHGGPIAGGTKVIIKGNWFKYHPEYGVIPYAKFGEKVVRCVYESTVRIICNSPPHKSTDKELLVAVSMNGLDFVTNDNMRFHYYYPPKVISYSPTSGPESGGTIVHMLGEKFTDLSGSPEFLCQFTSMELKVPPKLIPAQYENETSIICVTPGGWGSGNAVHIELTYNKEDYTQSDSIFNFYNIFGAHPRSGPADGTGGPMRIVGNGFRNTSEIMISFDTVKYKPLDLNNEEITVKIPRSRHGDFYFGMVPLETTINGMDYHKFEGGFQYYPQINVTDFYPRTGPAAGKGTITFFGSRFRKDFDLAAPACKFGNYYGKGEVINDGEMLCNLPEFRMLTSGNQFNDSALSFKGEAALNNYSFIAPEANVAFTPYAIFDIEPNAGPIKGGTQIMVTGIGFSKNEKARCRFGVPGNYAITSGKVIDSFRMICKTPHKFDIPKHMALPLSVPFSIAMLDDKFIPWTESGHKFRFYKEPVIKEIFPKEGQVNQILDVYVVPKDGQHFIEPLAPTGPSDKPENIMCRFGRFGETPGAFINSTMIQCITPATSMDPDTIYREEVYVKIALNGIDFTADNEECIFTFLGNATYFVYWPYFVGFLLAALLIIALIIFCASLWSKLFMGSTEKTAVAVSIAPHTVRDDFGLMRTRGTFQPQTGAPQHHY